MRSIVCDRCKIGIEGKVMQIWSGILYPATKVETDLKMIADLCSDCYEMLTRFLINSK